MKKDKKFQITMPQLQEIIKEEYAAMKTEVERAKKIKNRINKIDEELKSLPNIVSEVEASGTKKVKATGWTGEGNGDVKFGEKFEKKGTHLKETDDIEGEIELGGEDIEMEIPEMESSEVGYFETKLSELGKELDAKIGVEDVEDVEDTSDIEDINGIEDVEDIKDEEDEEDVDNVEDEEDVEDIEEVKVAEGVEEIDVVAEGKEVVEEKEIVEEKDDVSKEDKTVSEMEETKLEPIEGVSPIQGSDARFNDYMEKDKHVKEGVKKTGTTLLSEGYSAEKKSKLDGELERMKKLAKI